MAEKWQDWGKRFRRLAEDNGYSLQSLADKLANEETGQQTGKRKRKLKWAASTLRSWTNGTRDPNLGEFFRLCGAANVNASQVLFGALPMSAEFKQHLSALARTIVEADPAASPTYGKMQRGMRKKTKA
jgi:transcriptional regulator with XRE-family HTH domain